MYDSNATKLLYVSKVIDINSAQYTKSTPHDILYENMDNYINGLGIETKKRKATENFLAIARDSMENLKIRAIVKDAIYYKFITTKGNGWIEMLDNGVKLGKKPSEVVDFLKDPENEETLFSLMEKVEEYWKE